MADDQTIEGEEEAGGAVVQPPMPAPEDENVTPLPVVGEEGDGAAVPPADPAADPANDEEETTA